MNQVVARVENGVIRLPEDLRVPDGTEVQVIWDEEIPLLKPPLEDEPWTEEEMRRELEAAERFVNR